MNVATWWHQMKTTTTSGHIRDATACPLAPSIAESSRTPTRTTRIPIRMHTSHIAIAVHRAAIAMTPGTGSENTPLATVAHTAQNSTQNKRCNRAKMVPNCTFFPPFFWSTWLFFLFQSKKESHSGIFFLIELSGQTPHQSTVWGVRRFRPTLTKLVKFLWVSGTFFGFY